MFRCACIHAVILSLRLPVSFAYRILSEDLDSTRGEDVEPPTEAQQQKEFFQCTRQCRWKFGNTFDLTIVGGRSGWSNCQCFRLNATGRATPETLAVIPRYSAKGFDMVNTWSGNETSGWNCDFVCVQQPDASLATLTKEDVQSQMLSADFRKLHCGRCAACSSPEDIEVLAKTRLWITEVMTTVAARFAAPWGHHDPKRLRRDLVEANISFSEKRYDGRTDLPSCMDVWADNIMCDAMSCKSKCWLKFFNAKNAKTEITGDIKWYDLNAKCLRCDEINCGPAFIKGAGANRRSTGIESDIQRPEKQKCHMGMYSGVPEEELPTLPKPSV
eukprot:s1173_g21.t1